MDRLSFAAVAKAVGVADSTVRRWGKVFRWREEREEIARAESEIRANTVKARAHLLGKLLSATAAGDAAQGAYGFAALEKTGLDKQKFLAQQKEAAGRSVSQDTNFAAGDAPEDAAAQAIPSLPDGLDDAERVELLQQAVDRQLAYVLSNPVDDLSRRVKEIKAAMDVLQAIKGKDESGQTLSIGFEE